MSSFNILIIERQFFSFFFVDSLFSFARDLPGSMGFRLSRFLMWLEGDVSLTQDRVTSHTDDQQESQLALLESKKDASKYHLYYKSAGAAKTNSLDEDLKYWDTEGQVVEGDAERPKQEVEFGLEGGLTFLGGSTGI